MATSLKCVLFLLLTGLVASCDAFQQGKATDFTNEMVFETVDKEVMDAIVERLKKEGIQFIRSGDNRIKYAAADYALFQQISVAVISADLPAGRSISLPDHCNQQLLESRLKDNGIKYDIKERHGLTWVVWEIDKVEEGRSIAEEIKVAAKNKIWER